MGLFSNGLKAGFWVYKLEGTVCVISQEVPFVNIESYMNIFADYILSPSLFSCHISIFVDQID